MRIGIDGRPLIGNKTGIGRYVLEICYHLDKLLPNALFFVYSPVPINFPIDSRKWFIRVDQNIFSRHLKSIFWLKYFCGFMCRKDKLDLFWATASFIPRMPSNIKVILTVHDLNFMLVPHTLTFFHRLAFHLYFKRDLYNASAILTISNGTARRLKYHFGRDCNLVIRPSVNSSFVIQEKHLVDYVKKKYSIDFPFLLAVATLEPRKNLELLTSTFTYLQSKGDLLGYKLLLVGGKGWKNKKLLNILKSNTSIISLGYVPDSDLISIYNCASLFVFPSIYEGFGIPVAEAIACGLNVVATDIPELREAGDNDVIYIAPNKHDLSVALKKGVCLPRRNLASEKDLYNFNDDVKNLCDLFKNILNN